MQGDDDVLGMLPQLALYPTPSRTWSCALERALRSRPLRARVKEELCSRLDTDPTLKIVVRVNKPVTERMPDALARAHSPHADVCKRRDYVRRLATLRRAHLTHVSTLQHQFEHVVQTAHHHKITGAGEGKVRF